jgi:tRNA pseudouridine55 synthase
MNTVINLNKPVHISSHDAVSRVKRFFSVKKAGHAGTLDPIATGVLIVCLGEATKITGFLSGLEKEYITRLKLGERTDTFDSTGRMIDKKECSCIDLLKDDDIRSVLRNFTGTIRQIPPMYSAVKMGGQPLYKLARKGVDVERQERKVTIREIELLSFDMPYIELKVACSKGTYIRVLCDDIGCALGTGAHMVSLVRTRVGAFRIEDSSSFEDLKQGKASLSSIDSALSHLCELVLDNDSFRKAKHGMAIMTIDRPFEVTAGSVNSPQYIRLKSPAHELFAIGKRDGNRIKIGRLFNT